MAVDREGQVMTAIMVGTLIVVFGVMGFVASLPDKEAMWAQARLDAMRACAPGASK